MAGTAMSGVLQGLRVVEVAQGWAGPATTMYLADQGAEVTKIEPPGGDLARGWYPSRQLRGTSRSFVAINRGKRSIVADLAAADGRRIAQALASRADVVVVNLDPQRAGRLGVDYEQLSGLNPRLVYAAVSGYGRRGPYAGRPAYDQIIQGLSGAMDRRLPDGTPLRSGVWVADTSAPMLLAYGIALALLGRERTGRGQQVDTSLLEAAVALQVVDLVRVAADPILPEVSLYSSGLYRCRDDRYLNVAAFTERQVVALCTTLGLVDVLSDPSFLDDERDLTLFQRRWRSELAQAFATRPATEWQPLLLGNDVPCGPVLSRDEVFREPQLLENEIIMSMDHPEAGEIKAMGIPVQLSANPTRPGSPAPSLGQHTDEVLRELGYDDVEAQALRTRRVVG
jgi:crotonobetainyl-CoA:carnitine CoA-transferase CaiB-like acyl-CoA transferase